MEAPAPRRSRRDWLVDISLFVLVTLYGFGTSVGRLNGAALPEPAWLFDLDQVLGVLGCIAILWRRRLPVQIAVALVVASSISELVAGAMLVGLFTVAVHRPPKTSIMVFCLSLLAAAVYVEVRPESEVPHWFALMLGVALQGAAVGWGLFIHFRRRLVLSLRDRAERAETEAALRAAQAKREARDEIAREIHDVLGHRLSLLSLHAGALEYRPDAPAADVSRAVKVIRESSHQALQDLREVVGVLRAPVGELPQPTLADLPRLVEESNGAGMRVDLCQETVEAIPDRLGRTVFRIVQEALTNVRKHALGTEVAVAVAVVPERRITVEVRNSAPAEVTAATSDGQGLVGLSERVSIAGGRLEHGPTGDGGWRVFASIPWSP